MAKLWTQVKGSLQEVYQTLIKNWPRSNLNCTNQRCGQTQLYKKFVTHFVNPFPKPTWGLKSGEVVDSFFGKVSTTSSSGPNFGEFGHYLFSMLRQKRGPTRKTIATLWGGALHFKFASKAFKTCNGLHSATAKHTNNFSLRKTSIYQFFEWPRICKFHSQQWRENQQVPQNGLSIRSIPSLVGALACPGSRIEKFHSQFAAFSQSMIKGKLLHTNVSRFAWYDLHINVSVSTWYDERGVW